MLKFLCPNGHQLSAPSNMAGKAGKCPKCNTPFVVPKPEEVGGDAADDGSGTPVAEPAAASAPAPGAPVIAAATTATSPVTPAMGSGKGTAAPGELFVFLCPNGHRLNGPPSMKGKAGQCPHCGARFRIPTDDELDESLDDGAGGQAGGNGGGIDFGKLFGSEEAEAADEEADEGVEAYSEEQIAPPPPGAGGLGYIVGRLWERRTDGVELEVFLNEGEIVAPDFYSEILSSGDYGVFAVLEGDGSYAVTVVPWTAVRRVGMRRVEELPPELFE